MKKIGILSMILIVALLATILSPATVNADNTASEAMIASNVIGERTNIHFLEGKPGDTHLIYTYEQDGKNYKAIENASENFQNVVCQIFELKENGECEQNSVQSVLGDGKGNSKITIQTQSDNIEERIISILPSYSYLLQSESIEWEWITEYYDGSKGSLKGLAISALISVVVSIATYYSAGSLTSAAVTGAGTIATGLFSQNAEKVYYHAIRNWRHSPKNYFVIDETEWTEFFLDSSHIYSLGDTYSEYIY